VSRDVIDALDGESLLPALEPRTRCESIEGLARPLTVVKVVVQHVDERVAQLGRRLQDPLVKALGEDLALAVPESVQGASDADQQALHATGEGDAVLGFDDEVQVVGLHRVVQKAKPESLRTLAKRRAQLRQRGLAAQGRQASDQPYRGVDRVVP